MWRSLWPGSGCRPERSELSEAGVPAGLIGGFVLAPGGQVGEGELVRLGRLAAREPALGRDPGDDFVRPGEILGGGAGPSLAGRESYGCLLAATPTFWGGRAQRAGKSGGRLVEDDAEIGDVRGESFSGAAYV